MANVLAVALGCKKRTGVAATKSRRLHIPIRVHLGATINFQAGTVKRAPERMRKLGLEWLWRIKEEPQLWARYWQDGLLLLKLVLTRVAPLLLLKHWDRIRSNNTSVLTIKRSEDHKTVTLSLNGATTALNVGYAEPFFREAIIAAKDVVINCTGMCLIDTRFLGLLLMLNKQLTNRGMKLRFAEVPPSMARQFRLNGFEFLLKY